MLKPVLLSTVVLALVAGSANAEPRVTFSADNRISSTVPGDSHAAKTLPPGKNSYLWTTISKNANAAYFCCYGSTVSGPTSALGHAYGVAIQFVPSTSQSISKLTAAVGYDYGTSGNHHVIFTLYADNGNNSPGAQLAQATTKTTDIFGYCCGLVKAKITPVALTAGTPYWLAITTDGDNEEAAPYQVYNEVSDYVYISSTSDGGNTWGPGASYTEYDSAIGVR